MVSAVSAAIAALQDRATPRFQISGKAEALRMLADYVGDLHQPLHVAEVYLDRTGTIVDPDKGPFDPATETTGGNDILDGGRNLHREWDDANAVIRIDNLSASVLNQARAVAKTAGPLSGWSAAWATETLLEGKKAFADLKYSAEDPMHHYVVTLPGNYASRRNEIQRKQVIKAGARLAQILTTIWP